MDLSQRYQTEGEVAFQKLGEETVLVHLTTGRIHHTNITGSRIWELLEAGQSLGEIVATLRDEFDAPPGQLESEVEKFVEQLSGEKMVKLRGETA